MQQGLSEIVITYPIILKTKLGANFVTSFSQYWKNHNHQILQIEEFYIAASFQGDCFKTQ